MYSEQIFKSLKMPSLVTVDSQSRYRASLRSQPVTGKRCQRKDPALGLNEVITRIGVTKTFYVPFWLS